MSNITFDSKAQTTARKEDIEWLRLWCEEVNDFRLPHVALIGDSITEGYYGFVKKKLEGIARVDYLATSYSVASPVYQATVKAFFKDSDYTVVHYNYGLHAFGVDGDTYAKYCAEIANEIVKESKLVLATTTTVLDNALEAENPDWKDKVRERNARLCAIAKALRAPVDDLHALCKTFTKAQRNADGVHFTDEGYDTLSDSVVRLVKTLL